MPVCMYFANICIFVSCIAELTCIYPCEMVIFYLGNSENFIKIGVVFEMHCC